MSGGRIRTAAADASLVGCFSFFFPSPFHSFYPEEGKTFPLLLRGPSLPPRDDKEEGGGGGETPKFPKSWGAERGEEKGVVLARFFFSSTVRRYRPPLRTSYFLPPSPHSAKNTICHHLLRSPSRKMKRIAAPFILYCRRPPPPPPKRGRVSKQPHSSRNCAPSPNKTPSERGEKRISIFPAFLAPLSFSNTDFSLAD